MLEVAAGKLVCFTKQPSPLKSQQTSDTSNVDFHKLAAKPMSKPLNSEPIKSKNCYKSDLSLAMIGWFMDIK